MIMLRYAEIEEDSPTDARDRERQLLDRSIELLTAAEQKGAKSFESVEAIHFTIRLWSMLLEDLANDENALPKELRASLISIGIWILRESDAIRQGESENFKGILEISKIIRDGVE
ncbi:flagellar biosynthesis regulator FlaF [Oricola cellulosilytica]|uniref:Flagellar biosynthesis regulator FlaF n=1 Tax=Oricola cellulosilytica TaxID=1429082 RepID=A0A4R0PGM5_9HYPH|nr:flagellar biosynthesis regulator FlaF [Oricola cellulosilytica]TCD16218.1 flagellar biosynthesis regulator FlaF [Oricola cellulosilytica]